MLSVPVWTEIKQTIHPQLPVFPPTPPTPILPLPPPPIIPSLIRRPLLLLLLLLLPLLLLPLRSIPFSKLTCLRDNSNSIHPSYPELANIAKLYPTRGLCLSINSLLLMGEQAMDHP